MCVIHNKPDPKQMQEEIRRMRKLMDITLFLACISLLLLWAGSIGMSVRLPAAFVRLCRPWCCQPTLFSGVL